MAKSYHHRQWQRPGRPKGTRAPLLHPTTISQLLKAARKGHISLPKADRLATARHRRGARGHETQGYAK